MVKFSKNNFKKAIEVANICISDKYEINMSYKEFRAQLKEDRESGLLEKNGFKVDLRRNLLIDSLEEF